MGSLDCNNGLAGNSGTIRRIMSEEEFRNMKLAWFPMFLPWTNYQHYYLEAMDLIRKSEKENAIKTEDLPLI